MIDYALDALQAIDPACGREEWIIIAMSAKAAGIAFEDFDAWSSNAHNYAGTKSCQADWDHIDESGGITAATLFKYAKDAGWSMPRGNRVQETNRAQEIWDAGIPATREQDYIKRKWGSPDGLKTCASDLIIKKQSMRGALMIPCYVGSRLTTIQFITDTEKLNLPAAKYEDGYFLTGRRDAEKLYIVEGIGQAWALNALDSESSAAVAFGAMRMKEVAGAVKRHYPSAQVIIVPDRGQENKCANAAKEIGVSYVQLPSEKPKNYDINDLFQEESTAICKAVLSEVRSFKNTDEISGAGEDTLGFVSHEQQYEMFKNYVYINKTSRFIKLNTPCEWTEKEFSRQDGFSNKIYPLDYDNKTCVREAHLAFFKSTVNRATIIHDTYFLPSDPPHHVKKDEITGQNVLNTYIPHKLVKRDGDPSMFLQHIAKLLPSDRDQQILISWMSACVQNPGVKFTWWPLLQGVEGNGKSTIGRIMEHMIGSHLTAQIDATVLDDTSSKWKKEKFLVVINETKSFHDKAELWEKLKNCITEKTQAMRAMYSDGITIPVYYNGMMFSNFLDCVKKTESERRIVFFVTAQQRHSDLLRDGLVEFMPEYYAWLENGGYDIIAYFLSNYVIPNEFNPLLVKTAPVSSTTAEAIEYNRDLFSQKILDVIEEAQRDGFKGGFVASHALAELMTEEGRKSSAVKTRLASEMAKIGYVKHPALVDGRVSSVIDGRKPRLYVHEHNTRLLNLRDPSEIVAEYKKHNDEIVIFRS